MTPIDYKTPAERLKDVLFKVKLQPVYTRVNVPNVDEPINVHVPQYKAIVNQDTGRFISIVSDNYQLITNEEALNMGKNVFIQLYPDTKVEELIPFRVVAPGSLSSAHIDLIHKDVNFNVWEQET